MKVFFSEVFLCVELPVLRKQEADSEFVACRVSVIKWIANYMHQTKKHSDGHQQQVVNPVPAGGGTHQDDEMHQSEAGAHTSLESSKFN